MARSTSVIATVGASLLVVAIAAAAIRGTDDSGQPNAQQPTTTVQTTAEGADGTQTPDATPSPTEPASPTDDATTPDDVEAEGTAAPTETDGDQTGTDGGDGTDADTTDDADGTDGDSGDELPETGGGGLALLGAALAVAGATGGLRHRTT